MYEVKFGLSVFICQTKINHYEKMKHLITKVKVLKVDFNFCDILVYIHVNVYIIVENMQVKFIG